MNLMAGHILGARNIPMSQMKMRMKEIRPDMPVYLYCQSGIRSARAAQFLYRKGYKDLTQLKGGFKKWQEKLKRKNNTVIFNLKFNSLSKIDNLLNIQRKTR